MPSEDLKERKERRREVSFGKVEVVRELASDLCEPKLLNFRVLKSVFNFIFVLFAPVPSGVFVNGFQTIVEIVVRGGEGALVEYLVSRVTIKDVHIDNVVIHCVEDAVALGQLVRVVSPKVLKDSIHHPAVTNGEIMDLRAGWGRRIVWNIRVEEYLFKIGRVKAAESLDIVAVRREGERYYQNAIFVVASHSDNRSRVS